MSRSAGSPSIPCWQSSQARPASVTDSRPTHFPTSAERYTQTNWRAGADHRTPSSPSPSPPSDPFDPDYSLPLAPPPPAPTVPSFSAIPLPPTHAASLGAPSLPTSSFPPGPSTLITPLHSAPTSSISLADQPSQPCRWQLDDGTKCSSSFSTSRALTTHIHSKHRPILHGEPGGMMAQGIVCRWLVDEDCPCSLKFQDIQRLQAHVRVHAAHREVPMGSPRRTRGGRGRRGGTTEERGKK